MINTALILCAGYGKRLNPLTISKPKPLLKIKNITLLENTIKLLEKLKIKNIKINTFYLKKQFKDFFINKNFDLKIDLIEDGELILDTGGGIYNLIKHSNDEDFLVLNPDTIWELNYVDLIRNMQKFYFEKKIKNLLMVVNKKKSFDQRLKGDFELKMDKLYYAKEKNFIFTGCQLINKRLFKNFKEVSFPISKIWNDQINKSELYGYESSNEFVHLTDLDIYNKLNI